MPTLHLELSTLLDPNVPANRIKQLRKTDGSYFTKRDVLQKLIQAQYEIANNQATTIPYKKNHKSLTHTLTIEGTEYHVTLSHTIDIYPQTDGTLNYEVRAHTQTPEEVVEKKGGVVSYIRVNSPQCISNPSNNKDSITINKRTTVKQIVLEGTVTDETLSIQLPLKTRVVKIKKYFAPTAEKHAEIIKHTTATRNTNEMLYPETSALITTTTTNAVNDDTTVSGDMDLPEDSSTVSEKSFKRVVKTSFSMPYLGDAYSLMIPYYQQNSGQLPFDLAALMINGLLTEIKRLEDNNRVHGHLNLKNIVFNRNTLTAHMIDTNNIISVNAAVTTQLKPTEDYIAPEIKNTEPGNQIIVTNATHIYSAAYIICDLLGLDKKQDLSTQIISGVTAKKNKKAITLLQQALSENPTERPSIDTCIDLFDQFSNEYQALESLKTQLIAANKIIRQDIKRIKTQINNPEITETNKPKISLKETTLTSLKVNISRKITEIRDLLKTHDHTKKTSTHRVNEFNRMLTDVTDRINVRETTEALGENVGLLRKILNGATRPISFIFGKISGDKKWLNFGFFPPISGTKLCEAESHISRLRATTA